MREEKMLEKAVIFDIDGTLCDDTSRRKEYLTKGDWKNYLLDCQNSRPVECTRVLLDYYLHKGFKAIFVTGRPEALRTKTNHFLTSLGLRINVNFQRFPTLDAKKLVNAPKMSAHHRGICHF